MWRNGAPSLLAEEGSSGGGFDGRLVEDGQEVEVALPGGPSYPVINAWGMMYFLKPGLAVEQTGSCVP